MSIRRKWLRVVFLMMLGGACFFGGMDPKDIEETLHVMNMTSVEFSIPDEANNGDSGPDGYRSLIEIEDTDSERPLGSSD
jgi:hypothetical protein